MGTTFSGHAVATTLGNSLRVAVMISYICDQAGFSGVIFNKNEHIKMLVSGDDVYLRMTYLAKDKFIAELKKYYADSVPKEATRFGFGQCCKKANEGTFKDIDFLSKEGAFI